MQGQGKPEEEQGTAGMSPSELEELQRKNCVFCHIASGKVPARKVYEDDECIAVLDINPATSGHVLLMPKEHYTVMFQVQEQALGRIFVIAKGLSQAGLKAFQTKGATIFAANGVAAGQRAPHFMLHIIPRSQGDNIGLYIPSRALGAKEAKQIATALSAALGYTASSKQPPAHSEEKKEGERQGEERAEAATAEAKEIHGRTASAKPMRSGGSASVTTDAYRPEVDIAASEPSDLDSITDFLAGSKTGKGGGRP